MLSRYEALVHPYVIGELALGPAQDRNVVIEELAGLDQAPVASHEMVMNLIATRDISGIGYVDSHLLASALLVPSLRIWTRDKRLRKIADHLSIAASLA